MLLKQGLLDTLRKKNRGKGDPGVLPPQIEHVLAARRTIFQPGNLLLAITPRLLPAFQEFST
jgi:hypothetical protein